LECACCESGEAKSTEELADQTRSEKALVTGAAEPSGPDQCLLDEAALRNRVEQWKRLIGKSGLGFDRGPKSLQVHFRAEGSALRQLTELVRLEQVCCSELSWTVTQRASELLLTIGGTDSELDGLGTFLDA
jgi:hypothetical protein